MADERIGYLDSEVARAGDHAVVTLRGEIDMSTAHQFAQALDVAVDGGTRVEIDMRDVTFMDCSGLAVLAAAHQRLGKPTEAIVLREPSPTVRTLLAVTGVGLLVDVQVQDTRHLGGDRP